MDPIPTIVISNTRMPHCSGRVVVQLDQYIYLGESFKTIPKEHEIYPTNYDEAMSNVNARLWKKTMEIELEFMYSNHVLELVEVPKGIKPTRCK